MTGLFEDITVGDRRPLGQHTFTREAILSFARRFDPQSFHIDEEAARTGPFGRLAASGWHTASVWMKLNVLEAQRLHRESGAAAAEQPRGPSPGFKNLKWIRPVFVGDTITFDSTVLRKRPISNPAWGLVFNLGTGINQNDEPVFSFEGCVMVRRRRE